MKNKFKLLSLFSLLVILGFTSCQKEEYSFGSMKTPTALVLTTTVAGVDNANPAGNGTGLVTINVKATDALTYKVDFGDGNTEMVPSGVITYKYTSPGTSDYNITVNAIGTGGIISNTSKKITVYVAFTIPTAILQNLTGASSKIWICDKAADALTPSRKATSSKRSFLQPTNKISEVQTANKYLKFFIIINF